VPGIASASPSSFVLDSSPIVRMGLRFYNTLTRGFDPLQPPAGGPLLVYACGPTVYGHAHIGNFRAFLFYDLVHRTLRWKGFPVRFVMNFTDVDDKTIRGALAQGERLDEFTRPFIDAVLEECDLLGVRRFDLYPRATAYLAAMVQLVERLRERGLAYPTEDGSVFFDISAFPGYGKLSGKDLDQGRVGERVADDEYGKEDVRDFALWKGVKPEDEQVGAVWDTPWGRGRPGWHLECSAMALTELGETIDLHLGGEDLIFPHHEDEIAQSEGATGKPFVRHWMHLKHLRVEGRKMSKSLGNFITVRELLDEGISPAAIRHQLLSAQYRGELNFTRAGLEASGRAIARLLDFEARLASHPVGPEGAAQGGAIGGALGGDGERGGGSEALREVVSEARAAFEAALDDDLNVPEAMSALFIFLNRTNAVLDELPVLSTEDRQLATSTLTWMDEVLGLLEVGRRARSVDAELERWIEERIEERRLARGERDWARADAIRDELLGRGIVLEDGAGGTRWKQGLASG